jgi:hypothetical protein
MCEGNDAERIPRFLIDDGVGKTAQRKSSELAAPFDAKLRVFAQERNGP